MTRTAVVFDADVAGWLERSVSGGVTASPAVAMRLDDGSVHQYALAEPAEWRRAGAPVPAAVVRIDGDAPPLAELEALARAALPPDRGFLHLLAVGPAGSDAPCIRSWSRDGAGWVEDQILAAPAVNVFARNQAVLESRLLAGRKVVIVGLGSGGATIALELAKAGVGRLLLVDRDRIEVENVGRHVCDLSDLGRLKTRAVRDRVLAKNPEADVELLDGDVMAMSREFERAASDCDVLIGATDSNPSRRLINRIAVETGRPAIFGRAFARACGGDVIRVAPGGPCYECLVGELPQDEEIGSERSANAPAYADRPVAVEPGLALDIAPISLMCVRLALQELVRGTGSTLEALDADLCAPLYIWANRREAQFSNWAPMGHAVSGMAVMRWYGARAPRRPGCPVCDEEAFLRGLENGA